MRPKRTHRLTFGQVARALTSQLLQLDFASLRTAAHLTLGPGRVALAYVKGQRRTYVNPLKYAFLTATAYVLVINLFKVGSCRRRSVQPEPKRFLLYLSLLPYLTLPYLCRSPRCSVFCFGAPSLM